MKLTDPQSSSSQSRSSRRRRKAPPERSLFLGAKLIGELRILMRLASSMGNRRATELVKEPTRSF
jgi:hypothetical protein